MYNFLSNKTVITDLSLSLSLSACLCLLVSLSISISCLCFSVPLFLCLCFFSISFSVVLCLYLTFSVSVSLSMTVFLPLFVPFSLFFELCILTLVHCIYKLLLVPCVCLSYIPKLQAFSKTFDF